jgi:putative Ca2+/H+ antiporter (TMEM165/GDT1 family)
MLYAFAIAAILIALAELGDKTQLLALALTCKYGAWRVLAGIVIGILAIDLLSTAAGTLVGGLMPSGLLPFFSGALFIGFGIWTLRGAKDADDESDAVPSGFGPVLAVAAAFFLAEFGDKTQIMTIAIAADPAAVLRALGGAGPAISHALGSLGLAARALTRAQTFWGVWLGSSLGLLIADGIAIVMGVALKKKLPARLITRVSGVVFIVFGLASLVVGFLGRA